MPKNYVVAVVKDDGGGSADEAGEPPQNDRSDASEAVMFGAWDTRQTPWVPCRKGCFQVVLFPDEEICDYFWESRKSSKY